MGYSGLTGESSGAGLGESRIPPVSERNKVNGINIKLINSIYLEMRNYTSDGVQYHARRKTGCCRL